jgi:hypothetical protein
MDVCVCVYGGGLIANAPLHLVRATCALRVAAVLAGSPPRERGAHAHWQCAPRPPSPPHAPPQWPQTADRRPQGTGSRWTAGRSRSRSCSCRRSRDSGLGASTSGFTGFGFFGFGFGFGFGGGGVWCTQTGYPVCCEQALKIVGE